MHEKVAQNKCEAILGNKTEFKNEKFQIRRERKRNQLVFS